MNKKKDFKERKLTNNAIAKYKRVVDKWFVLKFNGAAAYRFYYPNVKKDTTAAVNFSRIQALSEMQSYIKEKHKEAAKVIQVTHEGILKELQNWLQFDVTETIGLTTNEIKALPIEIRRTITAHKKKTKRHYDKDGDLLFEEDIVELKFISKERTMDMVNKHLGFYEADNQQKATEISIHTTNAEHMDIVQKILNGEK